MEPSSSGGKKVAQTKSFYCVSALIKRMKDKKLP